MCLFVHGRQQSLSKQRLSPARPVSHLCGSVRALVWDLSVTLLSLTLALTDYYGEVQGRAENPTAQSSRTFTSNARVSSPLSPLSVPSVLPSLFFPSFISSFPLTSGCSQTFCVDVFLRIWTWGPQGCTCCWCVCARFYRDRARTLHRTSTWKV